MSPTPYWSSSSMNRPAIRSLTRLCAPKPSATPTMPALASSGAEVEAELAQHQQHGDGEDRPR